VRGYLAAGVGLRRDLNGLATTREFEGKDVYLPGVTVYLEDPQANKRSDDALKDLSGRFTVRVPDPSRYRLCWKSRVYGSGCLTDLISAGTEPLFLSTVRIKLPPKPGFVASFGKVRFADDSLPRTLEPVADINAFAMVTLRDQNKRVLAEVPVNNFGEYLLPYLPSRKHTDLTARIEKARSVKAILPDTYIKNPRVLQFHLTIDNRRPRLAAIVPVSGATGKRVQIGTPGDTVVLKAEAGDPDGDPLAVRWSESPGSGTLSANTGTRSSGPCPPGRHSVLASPDGKGGYDR
jgi:hypothetical protein